MKKPVATAQEQALGARLNRCLAARVGPERPGLGTRRKCCMSLQQGVEKTEKSYHRSGAWPRHQHECALSPTDFLCEFAPNLIALLTH